VRLRLPLAARNPLSLVGVAIATAMAVLFLALLGLDLLGLLTNPYIGLLVFVSVPTIFVFGLILIPIGAWWAARRRRRMPERPVEWPVVDLRSGRQRAILVGVFALTIVNLAIVSIAAYGGAHYMDSSEFCGLVCHTTMEPQYVAYKNGPHARVECAQCHIGPGAGAFVQAKLAGANQLLHVIDGNIPRPVPSPDRALRPRREACQQCHWPEKFTGDLVREIREYSNDEANTESVTTLQLHVGGAGAGREPGRGIHWHMNANNRVEFVSSGEDGETVPYVRVTDARGQVREYFADGVAPGQVDTSAVQQMDCMDCHNRPAHTFQPSAGRAIDVAMAGGRLPRDLPFLRREAVAAVSEPYATATEARAGIEQHLRAFYADRNVDPGRLSEAVAAAQDVWAANVFPAMKVTWGTYQNELGHVDAPGCFRCHDDSHKTSGGLALSQDCDLCHTLSVN
jgi:nitrate/TMAO reductase-like tetraheme cytochrome c subunit